MVIYSELGNPVKFLFVRLTGKFSVRKIQHFAGRGTVRKRKLPCNEVDRGSKFASPERGQTSRWCLSAKKFNVKL